jgi:hypothetical protein
MATATEVKLSAVPKEPVGGIPGLLRRSVWQGPLPQGGRPQSKLASMAGTGPVLVRGRKTLAAR